jgi:hypothetical protein
LGDAKVSDNVAGLSGTKDSRKELWEIGLGLVDQLSVAAGVTAKDKRVKDAKNAAAAGTRSSFAKKSRSSGLTGMTAAVLIVSLIVNVFHIVLLSIFQFRRKISEQVNCFVLYCIVFHP